MKLGRALFCILCCGLLLGGCGKKETHTTEGVSMICMGKQVTDEGMFYLDGYTQMMKFYDFKLDSVIPICDKPNCHHNSEECSAYLKHGAGSIMGCYGDYVYYVDEDEISCPLFRCGKNGANRKIFAELNSNTDEYSCDVSEIAFFADNQLIIAVQYSPYKAILSGELNYEDAVNINRILCVDLENGSVRVLKEFAEKASFIENLELMRYSAGKLLYEDKDTGKYYVMDVNTQEETEIFDASEFSFRWIEIGDGLDKIYGIRKEDGVERVYEYCLNTAEEICLAEVETGESLLSMRLLDGVLYYGYFEGSENGGFWKYDLSKRTNQDISREEYFYVPNEYERSENWYGKLLPPYSYFIPKDAFEKQDWEQVQVLEREAVR